MTNKCTIISQIITLLHVSTLSCHPHGAFIQYLATSIGKMLSNTTINIYISKSYCYVISTINYPSRHHWATSLL